MDHKIDVIRQHLSTYMQRLYDRSATLHTSWLPRLPHYVFSKISLLLYYNVELPYTHVFVCIM